MTVPAPACWRAAGPSHDTIKITSLGDRCSKTIGPASPPGIPKRKPKGIQKVYQKRPLRQVPRRHPKNSAGGAPHPKQALDGLELGDSSTFSRRRSRAPESRGPRSRLIGIFTGAAGGACREPPRRHFCRAVWVPRIVPYISPQIDERTFFLHAAGRSFSGPWVALACRGVAEVGTDRIGSTPHRSIARLSFSQQFLGPPTNPKRPYILYMMGG